MENWNFNSLKEVKEFAKIIGEELKTYGLKELSLEVLEFKYNYYATSSEYLGEFRIVLNKVLLYGSDRLPYKWINNIKKLIDAINKAFSN